MLSLVCCLIAAFVTAFSIYLLRPLAVRIGLIDIPGGRKEHQGHIPLVGGIAMFLGFAFALLNLSISLSSYRSFIAASALLVTIGVLDDFHETSAHARFFAQIAAALLMTCWGGNWLISLGNLFARGDFYLGYWGIPLTVFAVVSLINAINMLDGIDGLAGLLVLISLCALLFLAWHAGCWLDTKILALLISVVMVFLVFNFRFPDRLHALIFMGDAGSMFLGFGLVWFLVNLTQQPKQAAHPVIMLWLVAIPLFDVAYVILKRSFKGASPMQADRSHIHHLLQAKGLTALQINLVIGMCAIVLAGIGLWGELQHIAEAYLFWGFILAFLCYVGILNLAWKKIDSKVYA